MGVFRKSLSLSTLGAVDFRSDKERIARSARQGAKAQLETNRLLAHQNDLVAQGQRNTSPRRRDRGWDFTYGVSADDLWTIVTGILIDGVVRSQNDSTRTIEVASRGCLVTATVGELIESTGSGLRLRARASGLLAIAASDQKVQAEWSRLAASIDRKVPEGVECGAASSTSQSPEGASDALVGQLSALADLHASGALTEEQYEVAKNQVLS